MSEVDYVRRRKTAVKVFDVVEILAIMFLITPLMSDAQTIGVYLLWFCFHFKMDLKRGIDD